MKLFLILLTFVIILQRKNIQKLFSGNGSKKKKSSPSMEIRTIKGYCFAEVFEYIYNHEG